MSLKVDILRAEADALHAETAMYQAKAIRDEMVQEYELELEQSFIQPDTFTKGGAIGGTSYQGSITCTREELLKAFGTPAYYDLYSGDKVTVEWVLTFSDGTIATVYDYKRLELGEDAEAIPLFERFKWNIGGLTPQAAELVLERVGEVK
jgi:hypothetical protein